MPRYQLSPPPSNQREFTPNWINWIHGLYDYIYQERSWHEIGASGEPAFQNSWANEGTAGNETAAYKRNEDKLIMKGLIDSGTITDGTVIFTLPAGYRPRSKVSVPCILGGGSENAYRLEIQTDGDVAIYGVSGAAPALSINCIVMLDN